MNTINIRGNWQLLSILMVVLAVGLAAGLWLGRTQGGDENEQLKVAEHDTLYTCPMHPQVIQDEPGQCPICGMDLVPVERESAAGKEVESERRILYWVAPMDPTYISDKPGKSPMGMDLVPVYEGEEPGAGGALRIDPALVQNLGVRTEEVGLGQLVRTVRTVGLFEVNEESLATVNTKIEGWIENLYVDKTGQMVKKGEPLLTIYSPALVSTQEEYLSALRHMESVEDSPYEDVVESARSLVRASEQRLLYWDISPSQISSLERTGKATKTLTLHAPTGGVVIHKNAIQGMKVMPGQDLFKIANLETLWLQARLYEQDLPWVSEGDHAEIEVDYLPGETLSGTVTYLYPYLDTGTRDLTARIEVNNPDLSLKPGMFATVTIRHVAAAEAVLVPDEAVIRSGERDILFIDLGGGRFIAREVVLGLSGDDRMVEVRSGIRPGERIVTSAQFMLDSESRLQESIRKMLESRETEETHTGHGASQGAHAGSEKSAFSAHEHSEEMDDAEASTGHMITEGHSMDKGEAATEAGAASYYTCPMEEDKEVVTEEPGRCPKCGMELVPVDEVEYDHPLKHKH